MRVESGEWRDVRRLRDCKGGLLTVSVKKRLLVLLCALAVFLTGCTALLNREYSYSAPHTDYPVGDKSAVLQADNYQGLVNAILYFITEHRDSGLVHLTYAQDDARVERDLDDAGQEVREEDPLGAYAVEEIGYTSRRMSAYYEVAVSITYAHTVEEVAGIVPVAGFAAARQAISSAMAAHGDKCVFRISYFTGDAVSLRQLVRQTWLDTPLALAQPQVEIDLYPNTGTSRIVEVSLFWREEKEVLTQRSNALEQRALELLEQADLAPEDLTPLALLDALTQAADYDPWGEETAYAVLVEGRGNALGFAQALRLLCQLTDLEATVAEGGNHDEKRYWLIVNTPEGYRHLDPTQPKPAYATDEVFAGAGYIWDTGRYPACVEYTPSAETTGPAVTESPGVGAEEPAENT